MVWECIRNTFRKKDEGPMKEKVQVKGKLDLYGYNRGEDGELHQVFHKSIDNGVVDDGFDLLCDVLGNSTQPDSLSYMAVGDGVAGGDDATALTNETDRQSAAYAHTSGTKYFTLTATFTSPDGIKEYGLFNADSGGTMFNIASFDPITVDELVATATVTFS